MTMKKKVTLLCAVAAMGIAAAAGVSLQNRAQLSDVALANIEALASGEGEIIIDGLCAEITKETICRAFNPDGTVDFWVYGVWIDSPDYP